MAFTLRPGTVDDAETMVRMHIMSWRESYAHLLPEEFFAEREANIGAQIERQRTSNLGSAVPLLAHDDDGCLVGIAAAGPGRDEDSPHLLELYMLYTLRRVHGAGVGQALVDALLSGEAAYLWVLEGNPRAQAFYRRNGFEPDGKRQLLPPRWYELPEIRMVRPAVGR
ncbi:GNAT family N-acetyltransferase [Arthrobacter sp. ISL-30]|uniref:GNAT family N-acetyltransferase n=1 Tax=Arthrobacter sp. ISL-30 TaxID=2819109 RepID=UPI001BE88535|nr:GNAT family N-acetyltransferase [Arthrobacter sp. ISL-30]MBT2515370.1 GNAT family N-acetyltransferase [Arthrobacter sp. ISL-30]